MIRKMGLLFVFVLGLVSLTAGAASLKEKKVSIFGASSKETVQSIEHRLMKVPGCDDDGGADDWYCEDDIRNRSGTYDSSRCKESTHRIACYEDVREDCTERGSGRKHSREYRRYTGVCAASYSDCW